MGQENYSNDGISESFKEKLEYLNRAIEVHREFSAKQDAFTKIRNEMNGLIDTYDHLRQEYETNPEVKVEMDSISERIRILSALEAGMLPDKELEGYEKTMTELKEKSEAIKIESLPHNAEKN